MKIYCLELIIAFIFYLVVRWLSNVLYWQNGMFQFDWEKRYNYHPFDINPSSDRKKQAGNLMLLSLAPAIAMICTAACFQLLNISEDLIFSVLLIPIFFFLFRFVVIFMDGSRIYFGSVKNLVLSFLAPIAANGGTLDPVNRKFWTRSSGSIGTAFFLWRRSVNFEASLF